LTARNSAGSVRNVSTPVPRNAVTGTNCEGVGVKPDVATPSADVLKVPLERLGQSPGGS
jgi:hypothetical protein